jgi:hypothetical protein
MTNTKLSKAIKKSSNRLFRVNDRGEQGNAIRFVVRALENACVSEGVDFEGNSIYLETEGFASVVDTVHATQPVLAKLGFVKVDSRPNRPGFVAGWHNAEFDVWVSVE